MSKHIKRSISFPWGGGGNHIINMLSPDSEFNNAYIRLGLKTPTVENKLHFLKENIYPSTRTWYNWLEVELNFRPTLEQVIGHLHEYYEWELRTDNEILDNIPKGSKILLLEFDNPDLLLDHYWHINLGINSMTPAEFKKRCTDWMAELSVIKNRNFEECLVVNGELLHQPTLNEEFYNTLCDWFEFEPQFEHASKVHDMWIKCRVQSAKDFCNWFKGDEFQSYLERLERFQLTHNR